MKRSDIKVVSISPSAKPLKVSTKPLYSSQPAAGFPAPGDDLVEKPLDLNDLLINNPTSTFFVRVKGDSMDEAKIHDGDVLIVDRSVEPRSGHIVVAAVYGELVVKQLETSHNKLTLISANEDYDPVTIEEAEDCYVWGVVIGSARVLL
jgi:DNA polymerase V